MKDVIELTDTWACRITLCGNAETLCSGYDLGSSHLDEEEATVAACEAASKVVYDLIGDFPDTSSCFSDWNGGRYSRARFKVGFVAAEVYHRKVDYVDDGDVVWQDWEWVNRKDVPPVIRLGIEEVLSRACDAMTQKLQEAERHVPETLED
jgi:hypothetical protein